MEDSKKEKTKYNFESIQNHFCSREKLSQRSIILATQKKEDIEMGKFNIKDILNLMVKQNIKNKKKTIQRKIQPCWMYIITFLMTILSGTENLYVFLWEYEGKDAYIFFPSILFRINFFIICSYYLSSGNWKVILKLYCSFDRILVAEIGMMISVGVFASEYIPYTNSKWIYYSLYGLYPILLITFSGYYRIMMIYCQWKKYQTILIKISVALGAGAYFGLGMYYTVTDGKFTDGASPEVDQTILNILILFAFAGFDFHLELFSIIDETDGTNNFNLQYQLKNNPEDMDYLLGQHSKKQTKESICIRDHNSVLQKGKKICQNQMNDI